MARETSTLSKRTRRAALNWLIKNRPRVLARLERSGPQRFELIIGKRRRFFQMDQEATDPEIYDFAAFLLAAYAMPRGLPLRFDQPVSQSAALAVARLSTIFTTRAPHLASPLDLECTQIVPDRPTGEGRLLCLSGGIDSVHLAATEPDISKALVIQGFDFSNKPSSGFEFRRKAVDSIAAQFHLPLTQIATDFVLSMRYFEMFNVLFLAACLNLAGRGMAEGVFSSDHTRSRQLMTLHYGMSAGIDAHLSTRAFRVTMTGDGPCRAEKIKVLQNAAPEVLPHVRFCPAPAADGHNCGTCWKCMQTRFTADQVGVPQTIFFRDSIDPLPRILAIKPKDRIEALFELGRLDDAIELLPLGPARDSVIARAVELRRKFDGTNVPI